MGTGVSHIDSVIGLANVVVTLGANLLVQSALLASTGLLAAWILRRKGAAFRSAILRVTLLAILLCPLASLSLKAAGVHGLTFSLPLATTQFVDVPAPLGAPALVRSESVGLPKQGELDIRPFQQPRRDHSATRNLQSDTATAPGISSDQTPASASRTSAAPQATRLGLLYIGLTGFWIVASSLLLLRLLIAYARMLRVRSLAKEAPSTLCAAWKASARDMRVRPPSLLVHPRIKSPCLVGFFRPAILLPESYAAADPLSSREVIVHELAHMARRDCVWNLLGNVVRAVLFFQPLVWLLGRRIEDTSDEVADDYVVQKGTDRKRYANVLADIAESFQPAPTESLAGVGVVGFRSSLDLRVQRILDTKRTLSIRVSARATATAIVLALSATVTASLIGAGEKSGADAAARLKDAIALRTETFEKGRGNKVDDLRVVLDILEELSATYPDVDEYRGELGITQCLLGAAAHEEDDDSVSSEDAFISATVILEPLTQAYPWNVRYKHHLAECYSLGGWLLAEAGRPQEGLEAARRAVALSEEVAAIEPDNAVWHWYLAHILKRLSLQLIDLRLPHADTMTDVWRHLRIAIRLPKPEDREVPQRHIVLANRIYHVGIGLTTADLDVPSEKLIEQGRQEEAAQLYEEVVECVEELAVEDSRCHYHMPTVLSEYAVLLERIGRQEKAEEIRSKREAFRKELVTEFPRAIQERRSVQVAGPIVDYVVRISTSGDYRLYARFDGHDLDSRRFHVWIEELGDGPGGTIADTYLLEADADYDFRTNGWDGSAEAEWIGGRVSDERERLEVPIVWPISASGEYTLRFGGPWDGTALDAFVFQRADLPAPVGDGPEESRTTSSGVFLEENGRVTVEAEHYAARVSFDGGDWLVVPDEDPGDVAHHNFRGTGYLQVLPDSSRTLEQEFERLMRRIQKDPEDAAAYLARGALYLNSAKDYENAVADFSTAIVLQPDNKDAWARRGLVRAELGGWAEAARDFGKVAELEPHNAYDHYLAAIVELARGNIDSYRAACASVIERFGGTDVPNEAYWAAWACVLGPEAVSDFDVSIALAAKASQGSFSDNSCRTTLGGLLYRAGRFEEALASLQGWTNEDTRQSSPAYAWFFLAMAHHRLGHATEAHAWLEKAIAQAEQEIQAQPPWNRRLTLGLLRQEAEGLIRQTETALGTNESDTRS